VPHRLITIPFSHFCEKARWSLDAAGVEYVEEGHCPGLHRFAVRRAGGRHSVPLLLTDQGEALLESSLIVRFADARATDGRKLLPADDRTRDHATALERQLDDELAPHIRLFVYFHLLPRRPETLRLFDIRTPWMERIAVRVFYPFLRRTMERFMRIDAANAADSRDRTRRSFDQISALLNDGRPYLTGDHFTSADIAFAAFAAPLVLPPEHPATGKARDPSEASAGNGNGNVAVALDALPPELAAEARHLQATPAGSFAARLYRERRHRHPHVH
jgi:glutathione S-transferase